MNLIKFGNRWVNPGQIQMLSGTPEDGCVVVFEGGIRFECEESVEKIMERIRDLTGPVSVSVESGVDGPLGITGSSGKPEPKAKK